MQSWHGPELPAPASPESRYSTMIRARSGLDVGVEPAMPT
jgi:hypothetical protein